MLSVIVPTLNEESGSPQRCSRARQPGVREIIVVDGGSVDATRAVAQPLADRRALGAARSRRADERRRRAPPRGDILLFLHADTLVPEGFAQAIAAACAAAGGHRRALRREPAAVELAAAADG